MCMCYIDSDMYMCVSMTAYALAVLWYRCEIGIGISMKLDSEYMIDDDGSARASRISYFYYNWILCFGFGVV